MADVSRMTAPLSSRGPGRWLALVGIGEDGRAGLAPAAAAALDAADLVVGGERHLALAAPLSVRTLAWPSPLHAAFPEILAHRDRRVCVLATGDPFHHGVGVQLAGLVPPSEMQVFPQPSAYALACARLGWAQQDCALVSLHGRALERIIPHLQPGARILALSWDGSTPEKVAALLAARGMGGSRLTVLEAMGGPRERLRQARAATFDIATIDPLNTLAVAVVADEAADVLPLVPGLSDALFESDGQLTKSEVRAVTLAALAPRRGECLWDIGAGSGSVGIEWALAHPDNRVIAVEARAERAGRIGRNAARCGVTQLTVISGEAPAAFTGLPAPDAVFIGGGLGASGLFDAAWEALRPGGRLVANVVSLEGEARLAALFLRHGGTMRRIQVSRLDAVGTMHGWRPAMAVTQWRVAKS
jgi:precorrin-6Y C5,15-methyltransferase (decarboxylating)